MDFIDAKYKLTTSECFEDYLKFVGVGLLPRKIATSVSPVCILTEENGTYTFTMSSTFRTFKITFKPGEEFVEVKPDGTKVKSVVLFESDKMLHTQTEESGRKTTIVRDFTLDALTATITVDGWDGKCVRIHKLIG